MWLPIMPHSLPFQQALDRTIAHPLGTSKWLQHLCISRDQSKSAQGLHGVHVDLNLSCFQLMTSNARCSCAIVRYCALFDDEET